MGCEASPHELQAPVEPSYFCFLEFGQIAVSFGESINQRCLSLNIHKAAARQQGPIIQQWSGFLYNSDPWFAAHHDEPSGLSFASSPHSPGHNTDKILTPE